MTTFYRRVLCAPQRVAAPMVDQSELAFRMLTRRYGVQLCYTPMLHARIFRDSASYREEMFSTHPNDRPLIVQFCANHPQTLLDAARFVETQCDAIDINLGCPQRIARRGHYGAFLLDESEWPLVHDMVKILHENLSIPVCCKMRILPTLEDTLRFATMVEDAGAQLLVVHGRTRDMKGPKKGISNWEWIRTVREALSIPVIANGGIDRFEDVDRCIRETGVVGVMAAEALLSNPALFSGRHVPQVDLALEYLHDAETYGPTPVRMIRGHVFSMLEEILRSHVDLRTILAAAHDLPSITTAVSELKHRWDSGERGTVPVAETEAETSDDTCVSSLFDPSP